MKPLSIAWPTSFATIILAGSFIIYKYYAADFNFFLTVLGVIITSVAFAYGSYFIVLAVNAYSEVSNIKQSAEAIKEISTNINQHVEKIENSRDDVLETSERIKKVLHSSEEISTKHKHQSFALIEKLMSSVVSYAQRIPLGEGGDELTAKNNLISDLKYIRCKYICDLSDDFDNINIALLESIGVSISSFEECCDIIAGRFPDRDEYITLIDNLKNSI